MAELKISTFSQDALNTLPINDRALCYALKTMNPDNHPYQMTNNEVETLLRRSAKILNFLKNGESSEKQ